MGEAIYKLQPNRTLALRGFDDRGAAAALHSCTDASFQVSGVFRDSADFCVLVLYDADNYYEHPRLKYLPDFDFSGIVLTFTVAYSGLIDLSSSLFPTIDWPYLAVIREDGTTARIRLAPADETPGPWSVSIDFSALGIDRVRQMWLTFAPQIPAGAAYGGGEWTAEFTLWTVSGPNRALRVAGPGSVRVEETDSWCQYHGATWASEAGFYSQGFSRRALSGDSVSISWHCQSSHSLWLGTSLYSDRGVWGVSVDGDAETGLDCALAAEPQVNTRRLLRADLPAGEHTAVLRHKSGGPVYFDFLEAAVPSDVPEPETVWTDRCPAHDYGTDHTYKLSPQRLMWNLDRLGYAGPMNVYVSVYWWNQRKPEGRVLPSAAVQIPAAAVAPGYNVFVSVSGNAWGRYVVVGDTAESVTAAIAASVNLTAVGVWASSSGDILTIANRAATNAYQFDLTAWYETPARVDIAVNGSLRGGVAATWAIDETVNPVLNRGARQWIADLCRECAARGRELWLAYSVELLNPPAAWAARFPDGTPVTTATGFGTSFTTHCAFGVPGFLDYQKRVYAETAGIMADAGLTPRLQFGEFTWWYFAGGGGMAFYDQTTKDAAAAALGRPLQLFTAPDDSPVAADVAFLAGRLVEHCRAIRAHVLGTVVDSRFEILLPLDVNYPKRYGRYDLGGRLLHAVNVPAEFRSPDTAPFDQVKIEGLDFGAGSRDYDKARWAMRWPFTEAGWPKEHVAYLIPVFNGGCPWTQELQACEDEGIPRIVFWAFDHISTFGWSPGQQSGARGQVGLL